MGEVFCDAEKDGGEACQDACQPATPEQGQGESNAQGYVDIASIRIGLVKCPVNAQARITYKCLGDDVEKCLNIAVESLGDACEANKHDNCPDLAAGAQVLRSQQSHYQKFQPFAGFLLARTDIQFRRH